MSPLAQLHSSIWHPGTVYEATSFTVPFLIQLAAEPKTPDRVGVLGLIAAIASGTSYLEVHGEFLKKVKVPAVGFPGTPEFEQKKAVELRWMKKVHEAVAAGFRVFVELTSDNSDVAYPAANVLARIRNRTEEVRRLLLRMLVNETRGLYRAGLILLLALDLRQLSPS